MTRTALALALFLLPAGAFAHDTWVQTNTPIVRTGDAVHLDLLLGNHGNDHRDFKIAGKLAAESVGTFEVVAPDGKRYAEVKYAATLTVLVPERCPCCGSRGEEGLAADQRR